MKWIKYSVLSLLVVAGFGMQTVSAETSKSETKVDITFGGSGKGFGVDGFSTFENEAPAVPTCTKADASDCTKDLKAYGFEKTDTYAKQCYKYEDKDGKVLDKGCTKSYFVKDVKITSASDLYTGIPKNMSCEATFHTWGPKKTSEISKEDKVWKTKGKLTIANGLFSSTNPINDTYKIDCVYNAKTVHPFTFYLTKNSSQSDKTVSDDAKIQNIGVKDLRISVDGCFNEGKGYTCSNGDYRHDISTKTYNVGKEKLQAFEKIDFIKNHHYNWKAEIQYNDGTNGFGQKGWRDVTQAKETKWSGNPLDYTVKKAGWNKIEASFGTKKEQVAFWSHEVKKMELKKVATKKLAAADSVQKESYQAIVTFSDDPSGKFGESNPFSSARGAQEDWTNYVTWGGDQVVKNDSFVTYTFDPSQNLNVKRTATASLVTGPSLLSAQAFAAPMAASYNSSWQTTGFRSPMKNFLPPPAILGFDQSEWTPDINPYYFKGSIDVSGISNGISNR